MYYLSQVYLIVVGVYLLNHVGKGTVLAVLGQKTPSANPSAKFLPQPDLLPVWTKINLGWDGYKPPTLADIKRIKNNQVPKITSSTTSG